MRGAAAISVIVLVSLPLRAQDVPDVPPEVERYFSDETRARVIQARLYEKARHHALTFSAGYIPDDDFFVDVPLGIRYDYFFTETIGVEARGEWVFRGKSRLFNKFDLASLHSVTPEYEEVVWNSGLQFLWFPIYGKIALLGTGLTHLEAFVMGGLGAVGVKGHRVVKIGPQAYRQDETSAARVYGDLGVGLQVYLSRYFALRIEYVQFFYRSSGDNIFLPGEVAVGLTWFIVPLGVSL